jgi:hypothetical protein
MEHQAGVHRSAVVTLESCPGHALDGFLRLDVQLHSRKGESGCEEHEDQEAKENDHDSDLDFHDLPDDAVANELQQHGPA